MIYANSYRGGIPLELYAELQDTLPPGGRGDGYHLASAS